MRPMAVMLRLLQFARAPLLFFILVCAAARCKNWRDSLARERCGGVVGGRRRRAAAAADSRWSEANNGVQNGRRLQARRRPAAAAATGGDNGGQNDELVTFDFSPKIFAVAFARRARGGGGSGGGRRRRRRLSIASPFKLAAAESELAVAAFFF